jgi:hypothetical protein
VLIGARVIGAVLGRLTPKLSLRGLRTDGVTVVGGIDCWIGVDGRIGCGATVTFGCGDKRGMVEAPPWIGRAAGFADWDGDCIDIDGATRDGASERGATRSGLRAITFGRAVGCGVIDCRSSGLEGATEPGCRLGRATPELVMGAAVRVLALRPTSVLAGATVVGRATCGAVVPVIVSGRPVGLVETNPPELIPGRTVDVDGTVRVASEIVRDGLKGAIAVASGSGRNGAGVAKVGVSIRAATLGRTASPRGDPTLTVGRRPSIEDRVSGVIGRAVPAAKPVVTVGPAEEGRICSRA